MTASPRLRGLDERTVAALGDSAAALRQHSPIEALRCARLAASIAPDHPEVLRRLALALSAAGDQGEATALMKRAVDLAPDDAVFANAQGLVLQAAGRAADAIVALRRACALAPQAADIACNLARLLVTHGDTVEAIDVLERTLATSPDHRPARVALAELLLRYRARVADAIAHLRTLVRRDAGDAWAWSALAEIRQTRFDAADIGALEQLRSMAGAGFELQVRAGFAVARAYEETGDYPRAFAAYAQANHAMRQQRRWSADEFSGAIDAGLAAQDRPRGDVDELRGAGIVFIVGLPRSGSTLFEQILASHPRVCAGGECLDLRTLIAEESERQRTDFSIWAARAEAADWRRLGERYLERVAALRGDAPIFTDKLPGNWVWLGAALRMLPGARVVACRRDRLETAWACYRRLFSGGGQDFSYDFGSIAQFMSDYERSMQQWLRQYPGHIRFQDYEALLADCEGEVGRLLAFCGLDFDPACLAFFDNPRDVGTISASQVREPLRRDTARAGRYGALLDPLRLALGLPPFSMA